MALTEEQKKYDFDGDGVLSPAEQQVMAVTSSAPEKKPQAGTGKTTRITKLTTNTAKAMMEMAAEDAGYTQKFSAADIADFIKAFDKEQALQIETVVTKTAQKVTPGDASKESIDKTYETTAQTEYPSFFNPAAFAKDWIWSKVNFKDEKTLGVKAATALAEVRGVIEKFQVLGISDQDAKNAARNIASGKKTIEDYTKIFQAVAQREYPQFADRFKTDPTLTTYDIALPVIEMVAKTLQIDKKNIPLTHPIVLAYTRAGGADGKGPQPSYYDLLLKTKELPEYQATEQANNDARDSATAFSRALGFGI